MIDKKEILSLYSIYVQTITANEQRRLQISIFYLSLIGAGAALLGSTKVDPLFVIVPSFFVSLIWFLSIKYFRKLASAKFEVISQMESHFSIKPFKIERSIYKETNGARKKVKGGKKRGLGLSHLDMLAPLAFLTISGLYLLSKIILRIIVFVSEKLLLYP